MLVTGRSDSRLTARGALLAVGLLAAAGAAKAGSFDIVPSYSGSFPESLKPAVEHATQLWEGWLTNSPSGEASTLELTFGWQSLGAGILGTSMISWWGHAAGFAMTPAQYMVGTGVDSQGLDGVITFNSDQQWYEGTDGVPPSTEFDTVTVALHEIGHHLGMMASYRYLLVGWGWGFPEGLFGDYHLTRWDTYLRDQDGDAPAPWGTPEDFDETGQVTLVSPSAVIANQGNPVPIYTADPFEAGSSLAHVSQDGDALMWPSISSGVSRHGLYDYEVGIFTDLAWGIRRVYEVHATGIENRLWHHGAAWAGGLHPAAGAAVYLDAAVSSPYYVTVIKDASAASLGVSGPARLDIDAGTLTVSGATSLHTGDAQFTVKPAGTLQTAELTVEQGLLLLTGGTATVAGDLTLGGSPGATGSCTISAGSLSAANLYVGHGGGGTLTMNGPAAELTISGKLSLGPESVLSAVSGATIHMTGLAIENHSTNPAALAGLANLTLILEGGTEMVADVEAAGQDLGLAPAGWEDNFALGTLQLGGAAAGRIRLVNAQLNHDPPADEALYVNDLVLNPGAAIDFNGLNLYYLNGGIPKRLYAGDANLDGAVDGADYTVWADHLEMTAASWQIGDFNGDGIVNGADYTLWSDNYHAELAGAAVPEPAALSLLAFGACLPLLRRRGQPAAGQMSRLA